MAHFLYRPHILDADKVVTTDYLIRHCHLIAEQGHAVEAGLPVDLLCNAVEMDVRPGKTITAPTIFSFAGDTSRYAAPALAILDAEIHAFDAGLAWRSARISIGRFALPLGSDATLTLNFEGSTSMQIDAAKATQATAHRAAIHRCAELRRQNALDRLHMSLSDEGCAEHRVTLKAIPMGGDQ